MPASNPSEELELFAEATFYYYLHILASCNYCNWNRQKTELSSSPYCVTYRHPILTEYTHNHFTALLDFVQDYPGEPVPGR